VLINAPGRSWLTVARTVSHSGGLDQPTNNRSNLRRRRAKEMIRLAAAIIVRRTHLLVMRLGRERGAVDHNLRAKTHQILQELAAAFLTTGSRISPLHLLEMPALR
jgi:glycerol-3-phosphate dehydrogenase